MYRVTIRPARPGQRAVRPDLREWAAELTVSPIVLVAVVGVELAFRRGRSHWVEAYVGETPVGSIRMTSWRGRVWLDGLVVAREHRGRGVATALALGAVLALEAPVVLRAVGPAHAASRRLVQRYGLERELSLTPAALAQLIASLRARVAESDAEFVFEIEPVRG